MRRLLFLSLLLYGVLLAGLTSLRGTVVALAIPLAVYLLAAFLYSPEKPRLVISRTLSATTVNQDAPAVVTLTVTNQGAALEEVLIEDTLPSGLTITEGEPWLQTALPADATATFSYTVTGKRGHYPFRYLHVTVNERLGLFRRRGWLEVPGTLMVFPEPLKLEHLDIRPLRTRGYAGPIPSRQAGSGTDFFGVREYQMGDPLRWVNWRASARHQHTLFTNEFEMERIADVGLILDARQHNNIVVDHDSLFEHAIEATAGLAETFLNDGDRVGLLVYGRGLEITYPGYGKVQRERILRALANARTGDSLVFESLDYLPVRFFPAKSQIVLISPLREDDLPVLTRLRARGYQILVVSPDPVAFEAQNRAQDTATDFALRIIRVERELMLRRLRRVGIQVVDWQVDQPFDKVMRLSLVRPMAQTRIVRIER
ncbi:MAG TPA: DUF58 domain-containing protein [Anaerolineae bacterium]|nr:DUF58 domain-containing protein [Anaerolineae bacterium]HQK15690.1 DUF58 domain-containing protein [Anaerolineae bacterium]